MPVLANGQAVEKTAPTITNGKSELILVVSVAGSQDELFLRGKDWVFKTYNSGKTVEQYEDKSAGRLVIHARTSELSWKVGLGITNDAGAFTYDMTLDFKDNKARITIDNIVYKRGEMKNAMILQSGANLGDEYPANWPTLGKKSMTTHWKLMQDQANADMVLLADSFKSALTVKSKDF